VLGDRDFRSVRRADVLELHAAMKDRPASANYAVCVLSSLFTRIIFDWELADMRNPAQGIKRFATAEARALPEPGGAAATPRGDRGGPQDPAGSRGHINQASVWALELLDAHGRRRDEILTLTWTMVDWQHSLFNLPDTKTGQLKVPVSARVLAC
jgi:integrase